MINCFYYKNKNLEIKNSKDNIKSHDQMATFFSTTDIETLKSEGNEYNHFVSLIVNNEGTYTAAITRKINCKGYRNVTIEYPTFNNKVYSSNEITETIDETYLEYFMLDVDKHNIVNENEELNKRLMFLRQDKKENSEIKIPFTNYKEYVQKPIFEDESKKEIKTNNVLEYAIDPSDVDKAVKQLITGNIFAHFNKNLDLKAWGEKMEKVYDLRFPDFNDFQYFADQFIDSLSTEYLNNNLDYTQESLDEQDSILFSWSNEIIEILKECPSNKYLNYYIKIITNLV